MRIATIRRTALALAAVTAGAAALAHHSPAVFDRSQRLTLTGVVTSFSWTNPHSWIHLDVTNDEGVVENWTIEMNPATILARGGWTRTAVQAGDEVTVVVYPLRREERGGQFISITLPDGRTLGEVPAVLGETPRGRD